LISSHQSKRGPKKRTLLLNDLKVSKQASSNNPGCSYHIKMLLVIKARDGNDDILATDRAL
jgi:hypothetical protein